MLKFLVGGMILFLISLSGYALAANFSDPVDGTFKSVSGNTIFVEVPSLVSKSPVSNEDQNGDLEFQLNASTGYRNFNQLTDLKYGDAIRIEYTQDPAAKEKQQMVAVTITKMGPATVVNPAVTTDNTYASPLPAAQNVTTTTTTRINNP